MALSEQEVQQANLLLRRMKTEHRGWIPEGCFDAFYDLAATPFYELAFYVEREGRYKYLLAYWKDEWWDGFHVMGGMVKPGFPADPWNICQTLTEKEFKEHGGQCGIAVRSVRIISSLNWQTHPWCHPLAVLFLVEWGGDIIESDTFGFYSLDEMPPNTLPNHNEYLRQCEEVLRTGRPLVFTRENPLGLPSETLDAGEVVLAR